MANDIDMNAARTSIAAMLARDAANEGGSGKPGPRLTHSFSANDLDWPLRKINQTAALLQVEGVDAGVAALSKDQPDVVHTGLRQLLRTTDLPESDRGFKLLAADMLSHRSTTLANVYGSAAHQENAELFSAARDVIATQRDSDVVAHKPLHGRRGAGPTSGAQLLDI